MKLKILLFSTLYPNRLQPRHGIFVETRLLQLLGANDIEARVVAPVPWFPFNLSVFGRYALYAKVPRKEYRSGICVLHPRFFTLPVIGTYFMPFSMGLCAWITLRSLKRQGFDFKLIDSHFLYPDGVAAVIAGRLLGSPVVMTARGSDVAEFSKSYIPRTLIKWACRKARWIITVSTDLKKQLISLGINDGKLVVLRNGVDLEKFVPPENRHEIRQQLGMRAKCILSVGNLVKLKGHDLVIRALEYLDRVELIIIGEGPEKVALEEIVANENLTDRVTILPVMTPDKLKDYYGAADVLVLASSREGWANVLLESMACGTPVIATDVGGNGEVVSKPVAGLIVGDRNPRALANRIEELLSRQEDRMAVRAFAERFSWDDTSKGQLQIFKKCLVTSLPGLID